MALDAETQIQLERFTEVLDQLSAAERRAGQYLESYKLSVLAVRVKDALREYREPEPALEIPV